MRIEDFDFALPRNCDRGFPYEWRDPARLLFIAASRQIRNLPMLLQTGQSDRFPGMARRA
jgi:S-adenosylmethionine:tRNA-ribosyltransferase-isomerase (queuine synthetase)